MSKIDEAKLAAVMKNIATTMQEIAQATLTIAGSAKLCSKELTEILQTGTIPAPTSQSQEIPNFSPDPYADMLRTEQGLGVYEVYPIKFLGTDNFKEISEIVRKLGGSYVHGDRNQGVKAHFTIPKEKGT